MKYRRFVLLPVLAAMAAAIPGSSETARAGQTREIRLAMLAPRGSIVVREFEKADVAMRKATNNAWGLRIYPSGMAGDETDMIRKMRINQMDSAIVTSSGLSQIVPPVAIMDVPDIIRSYEELEAVQKETNADWEQIFLKNGVKLLSWWEAGQVRLFSKGPVQSKEDFRRHRPWVWPLNYVMKELWVTVGVVGVPLGIPDVFQALQTRMIDMLVATPVTFVALQWHLTLDCMTKKTAGVLLMSWILNKSVWDDMPEDGRAKLTEGVAKATPRAKSIARSEDVKAVEKLVKMGYKVVEQTPAQLKQWHEEVELPIKKKLTGRLYSQELLDKVESITARFRTGA